ncbi:MAG: glycine--tRNA ligase subunit beta [Dethiobacter sp.]|nr:glycine--tRNA ligase subunit beta [Dethiobacter sp.]MBS3899271.1 glycine--tRNA ligase subunit beta [Dethiobacter sp.]
MRKETFLLEIGTEEIPARFIGPALAQLEKNARTALQEARLTWGEISTYGTPRRLVLLVENLLEEQAELSEQKKGPARKAAFDDAGNPTKAALGFARSQGVTVDRLSVQTVEGVEYVFATRQQAGEDVFTVLPSLCEGLIRSLSFPKPMFWHSKEIRFARPVRWLTALYGSAEIPFSFAGLISGRKTAGHRFLAPGPLELPDATAYLSAMEGHFVLVDPARRSREIVRQVEQAATSVGGRSIVDQELLLEVVNLVEYPKAVVGKFAPEYLKIPQEVLITAMRAHQRYFPVFEEKGNLMPYFIAISNGTRDEYLDNVRAGNERVLRARLADARFFFAEDRKLALADYVAKLDEIIFLEPLGTMRKKTERLLRLCGSLSKEAGLSQQESETVERAAFLAKADLLTQMVCEFPELQGTMGMHYARFSGERDAVARAVAEHYAPRHATDLPAETLPGAILAVADKMDTLAACFGLGLIPSGSQDPYALRRCALGVVATMLAHGLTVPLNRLSQIALAELSAVISRPVDEVAREMEEFLLQRVRFLFAEKSLRYDVIDAALGAESSDLPGLLSRAELLQSKLDTPELARILTPFTRAGNLTRGRHKSTVLPQLFSSPAEEELYRAAKQAAAILEQAAARGDLAAVFAALAPLSGPIDDFFSAVMVMAEDEAVKGNRLALLTYVRDLFLVLGDLGKIVQ